MWHSAAQIDFDRPDFIAPLAAPFARHLTSNMVSTWGSARPRLVEPAAANHRGAKAPECSANGALLTTAWLGKDGTLVLCKSTTELCTWLMGRPTATPIPHSFLWSFDGAITNVPLETGGLLRGVPPNCSALAAALVLLKTTRGSHASLHPGPYMARMCSSSKASTTLSRLAMGTPPRVGHLVVVALCRILFPFNFCRKALFHAHFLLVFVASVRRCFRSSPLC